MDDPLDAVGWPVRTERLLLRRATADDARALWAYRRLDEVSRWITAAPATFEDFEAQGFGADQVARTVVVERRGTVVGDIVVSVVDGWGQAEVAEQAARVQGELGWVLDPQHQGHGYATEALTEVLRICFEVLGLRRVTAACFAANEASWRLMERLGMRREMHTVKESLHRTEGWLDGLEYALLADEWRDRLRH
jgi:RimJ/RimL family protein N-acetyltransferase